MQVILKPAPADSQELYLGSLTRSASDAKRHDLRFVEDDWESPTLGASGVGWEIWLDDMESANSPIFSRSAASNPRPGSTELTYGLERLATAISRA